MIGFGGPIAEFFGSLGTVAAGGAFLGTAIAVMTGAVASWDRRAMLEAVGVHAAILSVVAVVLSALEEAVG